MSVTADTHDVTTSTVRDPQPEHLLDGRILLATDGSASADGAAGLVAELCRRGPCRVSVLAVFEPAPMPVPSADPSLAAMTTMSGDAALRDEFFVRVERQVGAFSGCSPRPIERAEGSPVRSIVEAAANAEADLIVTGLRVHSLMDRLVGDETALRVRAPPTVRFSPWRPRSRRCRGVLWSASTSPRHACAPRPPLPACLLRAAR